MSDNKRVVVTAPAKINLCLHVGNRRADDYHDLESLVAFATVGDVITIEPDNRFSLAVDGPFAAMLGAVDDNLALRAARLLAPQAGAKCGARICLTKYLPVASGIGGGSADAAAVLRALVLLWNLDFPRAALHEFAASLGADVPVCVESAPAWMEGKGERVTLLPALPPVHLLLANPGIAVPTGPVFAALRDRHGVGFQYPKSGFSSVAELLQFLRTATNDLEKPARAIAPEVGEVLAEIEKLPGLSLARMSGSGATCFGIFESDSELTKSADMLAARFPDWWIKGTRIAPQAFAEPVFVQ